MFVVLAGEAEAVSSGARRSFLPHTRLLCVVLLAVAVAVVGRSGSADLGGQPGLGSSWCDLNAQDL